MESTPKVLWSRKRKLQAKMERIRQAKLTKLDTTAISTTDTTSLEPTTSQAPDEPSEATSLSLEGTAVEQEQEELAEPLDESLSLPVSAQLLSDQDTGQSSDSDDDSSDFTIDDAQQKYHEWLKQQPKHSIKVIAVMFMDSLKSRFGMTTVGAAME